MSNRAIAGVDILDGQETYSAPTTRRNVPTPNESSRPETGHTRRAHPLYSVLWYGANSLLLISLAAVLWSACWEYSTREYLKGFSDAIVPFSSTPEQKAQAILDWMSHGPARMQESPGGVSDDRDPADTLNYAALLKVCGTATNAFINLADSSGLPARRLLLLDKNRSTMHVVAEVPIGGRWIVVDPAFRAVLRDPGGALLTREDLAKPTVFAAATAKISDYDPAYVYSNTVHIRLSRFGGPGRFLQRVLSASAPGWEDSAALSLLVERESLGALALSVTLLFVFFVFRAGLRWYGESHLGIASSRFRWRIVRLGRALMDPAG